jgi:hypothetical protein
MDYGGAMSTDTLLVADAETLEFRQGGPAIGGIWLVTESGAFPQVGWSDFVCQRQDKTPALSPAM